MYVRRVKRKCSVRGCKNTDCFAISQTREVGNTVIICKSCLEQAPEAIDNIDPSAKSNIQTTDNMAAPSLFFNAKALGTDAAETKIDDVPPVTNTEDSTEETNLPENVTEFKCPICGKTFDNEKGLKTHLRYCKQQIDKE